MDDVKACKVSVVMAVFNSEKYLRETLDSIIDQSLNDIEVICVDDGSTDTSVEIIKEYCEKDSRVKLLMQEEESNNAAKARNLGIKHSIGEYIAVLDSDDLFEKDLLRTAYETAIMEDADVVAYDGFVYDTANQMDLYQFWMIEWDRLKGKTTIERGELLDELFLLKTPAAWNMICKRKMIVEYDIRFRAIPYYDDLEYTCLALCYAKRISFCKNRFIHYRREADGNQSSKLNSIITNSCEPIVSLGHQLQKRGIYDLFKNTFIAFFLRMSLHTLRFVENRTDARILFDRVKEYASEIEKYGIEDIDGLWRRQIMRVLNSEDYYHYLFNETRTSLKQDSDKTICIRIPKNRGNKTRIVLYGAGKFGKQFHGLIEGEDDLELVAWVDINQSKKNGEIIHPGAITDLVYDFVYVAILSEKVFEEVKSELKQKGVKGSQILWMGTGMSL